MSVTENKTSSRPELKINLATPADYERVGDIVVDAYLHAGYFDNPQDQYLGFVRQVAERAAECEVMVARLDEQVIASMTLIQAGNRYADVAREGELEIRMLSVDPTVQRIGAGRAMVLAAVERAKELPGLHTVSLTTGRGWIAARGLYESLGFVHHPERDWVVPDTDIRLVVYVLELQQ